MGRMQSKRLLRECRMRKNKLKKRKLGIRIVERRQKNEV
jgi:hypothetical protein